MWHRPIQTAKTIGILYKKIRQLEMAFKKSISFNGKTA